MTRRDIKSDAERIESVVRGARVGIVSKLASDTARSRPHLRPSPCTDQWSAELTTNVTEWIRNAEFRDALKLDDREHAWLARPPTTASAGRRHEAPSKAIVQLLRTGTRRVLMPG